MWAATGRPAWTAASLPCPPVARSPGGGRYSHSISASVYSPSIQLPALPASSPPCHDTRHLAALVVSSVQHSDSRKHSCVAVLPNGVQHDPSPRVHVRKTLQLPLCVTRGNLRLAQHHDDRVTNRSVVKDSLHPHREGARGQDTHVGVWCYYKQYLG